MPASRHLFCALCVPVSVFMIILLGVPHCSLLPIMLRRYNLANNLQSQKPDLLLPTGSKHCFHPKLSRRVTCGLVSDSGPKCLDNATMGAI
ncbi:hypothetical protein GGR57DRAFT_449343 [Xylariaceae sp. FL1272]|nr:hypothetical protein GGR57DRAFT_449343 [Xylariaceae sp. FL1272]